MKTQRIYDSYIKPYLFLLNTLALWNLVVGKKLFYAQLKTFYCYVTFNLETMCLIV